MDLSTLFTSLQNTLGTTLPLILAALAILIIGWLVAVIARAFTRRILALLKVNARIEESTGEPVHVESGIAIGVFWIILLITLVAMLDSLHLDRLSNPFAQLVGRVIGYLPSLVAGTILALVAWLLATFIRAAVNRILAATTLDETLSREAGHAVDEPDRRERALLARDPAVPAVDPLGVRAARTARAGAGDAHEAAGRGAERRRGADHRASSAGSSRRSCAGWS